jgi:HEAT repeat protein
MRKRLLRSAIVILCVLLPLVVVPLVIPDCRNILLGLAQGEGFYDNRRASQWQDDLRHADSEARRAAAFALGQMGDTAPETVAGLTALLKDDEPIVRLNASLALYKIGPAARAAVASLGEGLTDDVPAIRMNCALALSRMGSDSAPAVPQLIAAFQRGENRTHAGFFPVTIRGQVASTLGKIGPPAGSAVAVLTEALGDTEPHIRCASARALGLIGGEARSAVPALVKLEGDEDQRVRHYVRDALKRLDPQARRE